MEVLDALECGTCVLEMRLGKAALSIVDDILATGRTFAVSAMLAHLPGHEVTGVGVVVDLQLVQHFCWEGMPVRAAIGYGVA